MLALAIFLISCAEEQIIPVRNPGNQPIDRGIYDRDSAHSDVFCDFILISNIKGCWNQTISVSKDCHYDLLFTRYNNGWTGADATYSMALPDGRIMWMFGDTFLGTVRADRTRDGSPFIRNSLIIQEGDELRTLYQGTSKSPKAFVSPQKPGEWYWPLDASLHNGQIQWMLGRLETTGSEGAWSFRYVGFDLAILDPQDFSLRKIHPKISNPDISYGSCVLEGDDFIYIYGISSRPLQKRAHIARAPGGDLSSDWEFFNGKEWSNSPSNFVVQNGVSDQFSVIKEGNIYYLVTHEIIFGNRIFIMESLFPHGPFTNQRILYCTPEKTKDVFTYNTSVHPELSIAGELRISYNINSFDFSQLFVNADLYRPRFLRIDNWR